MNPGLNQNACASVATVRPGHAFNRRGANRNRAESANVGG